MSEQPKPDSYLDDLRELLVDFGIPVLLLVILTVLLLTGINSEVKTLFAATVGWLIKSGVSRVK
jgi:hypothetical protein